MTDTLIITRIAVDLGREFFTVRVTSEDGTSYEREFGQHESVATVFAGIVDGSVRFWEWSAT